MHVLTKVIVCVNQIPFQYVQYMYLQYYVIVWDVFHDKSSYQNVHRLKEKTVQHWYLVMYVHFISLYRGCWRFWENNKKLFRMFYKKLLD